MVGHTSQTVRETVVEMDRIIAGVMPRSWPGHARLKVVDEYDLEGAQQDFAVALATRLMEKDKANSVDLAAAKAARLAESDDVVERLA